MKTKELSFWCIVYELLWFSIFVVIGFARLSYGWNYSIYSIDFIKSHGVLFSTISIWLNSEASFLLGGILVVLHPILGLIPVVSTRSKAMYSYSEKPEESTSFSTINNNRYIGLFITTNSIILLIIIAIALYFYKYKHKH